MTIFAKLVGAFALVAGICAIVGCIGWYGIYHTRSGLDEVAKMRLPATQGLGLMMEAFNGLKSAENSALNGGLTLADRREQIAHLDTYFNTFQAGYDQYAPVARSAAEEEAWQAFSTSYQRWKTAHDQIIAAMGKVRLDDIEALAATLIARHLDHVKWVAALEQAIAEGQPFTGQLDPTRCGLGKWLASYRSEDQEFMALLGKFAEPHKKLHELGHAINADIAAGRTGTARATLTADVKPTLAQIETIFDEQLAHVEAQIDYLDAAKEIASGSAREAFTSAMQSLDKLSELNIAESSQVSAQADSAGRTSQALALGAVCAGVIAALVLGFLMARSIARPMAAAVEMISTMERGVLTKRLNMTRQDEVGAMAAAMDKFADSLQHEVVDSLQKLASGDLTYQVNPRGSDDLLRGALQQLKFDLNGIMGQIRTAGEQIASGAGQVSDASQSLSQGATESASSLEEISASLNEMTSQVRQSAENASQANSLASAAQHAAEQGNRQMQQMVAAMTKINEAGQNISRIIKVIDEIAFQTNLLALNAAVEAARAGQHGKGFAVVAEEVRNLAARSAKAAKETAELIESSVAITTQGSTMADQTATELDGIVAGITRVSDLVAEIAAASNEQAQGIAQVNQGLGQIDQVTQQNTANAEESAAASEELSSQASQLRSMLGRFTLDLTRQQG